MSEQCPACGTDMRGHIVGGNVCKRVSAEKQQTDQFVEGMTQEIVAKLECREEGEETPI